MDEDKDAIIIVSCFDIKCLDQLKNSLGYIGLFINIDLISRLKFVKEKWDDLSFEAQEHIMDFAGGFVCGWEAAKK